MLLLWVLSHVQVFATPWIVAHQAPLSMGFLRQESWSGLPFSTSSNSYSKSLISMTLLVPLLLQLKPDQSTQGFIHGFSQSQILIVEMLRSDPPLSINPWLSGSLLKLPLYRILNSLLWPCLAPTPPPHLHPWRLRCRVDSLSNPWLILCLPSWGLGKLVQHLLDTMSSPVKGKEGSQLPHGICVRYQYKAVHIYYLAASPLFSTSPSPPSMEKEEVALGVDVVHHLWPHDPSGWGQSVNRGRNPWALGQEHMDSGPKEHCLLFFFPLKISLFLAVLGHCCCVWAFLWLQWAVGYSLLWCLGFALQ